MLQHGTTKIGSGNSFSTWPFGRKKVLVPSLNCVLFPIVAIVCRLNHGFSMARPRKTQILPRFPGISVVIPYNVGKTMSSARSPTKSPSIYRCYGYHSQENGWFMAWFDAFYPHYVHRFRSPRPGAPSAPEALTP
jgi:hypothetical protein